MKILVLGGSGMLGHKIVQRLARTGNETWWTLRGDTSDPGLAPVPELRGNHAITKVNATDIDAVEAIVRRVRPDAVVNCVGVIKQRAEALDPIQAITINSLLPHRLAALVGQWGARLIHFSTDCVFSGSRGGYDEDDPIDAEDLYGRSKALGEAGAPHALTIRTSIIGRELRHHLSLLDWFLSQNNKHVHGYTRAWWSGVTTNHLADVVTMLLEQHAALRGVYQLSGGKISKYELLLLLRDSYDLNIQIEADDRVFCDRSLVGTRFEAATRHTCPPYETLVREMAADTTPYPKLGE